MKTNVQTNRTFKFMLRVILIRIRIYILIRANVNADTSIISVVLRNTPTDTDMHILITQCTRS